MRAGTPWPQRLLLTMGLSIWFGEPNYILFGTCWESTSGHMVVADSIHHGPEGGIVYKFEALTEVS